LGLPFSHFWCKLVWNIFLAFLVSSIWCRCPIHLRHWSLMKILILMSVYSSSSLEFVHICRWLSPVTGPNIFLLKVINVLSSDLFIVHVSAP
jgi:hypothetical protein